MDSCCQYVDDKISRRMMERSKPSIFVEKSDKSPVPELSSKPDFSEHNKGVVSTSSTVLKESGGKGVPHKKKRSRRISLGRAIVWMCFTVFVLSVSLVVGLVYSSPWSEPRDIRVTNVVDRSVTISWVTEEATAGSVIFSEKDNFLPWMFARGGKRLAADDRDVVAAELEAAQERSDALGEIDGAEVSYDEIDQEIEIRQQSTYFVHHVTLTGLEPETTYYFRVGNGWRFDVSAESYADDFTAGKGNSFVTYQELDDMVTPNPSYGTVLSTEGTVVDAVIFMSIDSLPASPASAAVNSDGAWYIDLSNLRTWDGERFAGWDESSDSEVLFVEAGPLGQSEEIVNPMSVDAPADPVVVAGEEEDEAEDAQRSSMLSPVYAISDQEAANRQCTYEGKQYNCDFVSDGCSGDFKPNNCPGTSAVQCCVTNNDESDDESDESCPGGGECMTSSACLVCGGTSEVACTGQSGGKVCCECTDGDAGAGGNSSGSGTSSTTSFTYDDHNCTDMNGTCVNPSAPGSCTGSNKIYYGLCGGGADRRCCAPITAQEPNTNESGCGEVQCGPDRSECWTGGTGGGRAKTVNGKTCTWAMCKSNGKWEVQDDCCGTCGAAQSNPQPVVVPNTSMGCCESDTLYNGQKKYDWTDISNGECPDGGVLVSNIDSQTECDAKIYQEGKCCSIESDTGGKEYQWQNGTGSCPSGYYFEETLSAQDCVSDDTDNTTQTSTDVATCTFGGVGQRCDCEGDIVSSSGQNYYCGPAFWYRVIGDGDQCILESGETGCYCPVSNEVISPPAYCGTVKEVSLTPTISKTGTCDVKQPDINGEDVYDCFCENDNFHMIHFGDYCPQITEEQCENTGIFRKNKICNTAGNTCVCPREEGRLLPKDCHCTGASAVGMSSPDLSDTNLSEVYLKLVFFWSEHTVSGRCYAQNDQQSSIYILPDQKLVGVLEGGVYCVLYQEKKYCFDAPTGLEAQLFIDLNLNGVYDSGDIDISDDTMNITLTQEARIKQWALVRGYNFVSFDLVNEDLGLMATEFLASLNGIFNDAFLSIATFESGRWIVVENRDRQTYGAEDFEIIPGRGYLLKSQDNLILQLSGKEVIDPVPVSLMEGWNLVAVHGTEKTYTASSLIDAIDTTDGLDADNVTKWDVSTSRYSGLQKERDAGGNMEVYGFDFPIDTKLGYFVRIASGGGIWTPEADTTSDLTGEDENGDSDADSDGENSENEDEDATQLPSEMCEENGGEWQEEYTECVGLSLGLCEAQANEDYATCQEQARELCESYEGEFEVCASPCRHDADYPNGSCITSCDEVCTFE